MKILLLGEYSALHKNLKEGLEEIGHHVVLMAAKDGFKKIPVDIDLDNKLHGVLGKIEFRLRYFFNIWRINGFDVVQIINAHFFDHKFFPSRFLINSLVKKNKKVFLLAAGDDAFFWQHGRGLLRYNPIDTYVKYDLNTKNHYLFTKKALDYNDYIASKVSGIIPVMFEYEVGYKGAKNLLPTIPIPINVNSIEYKKNVVVNKLFVFHGLNRPGFKGTFLVQEAFDELKKRYPDRLELLIAGKLPLDDYLEIMQKANVIVDQVFSYSLGVNGVYALAMGKVVLGGAEPESLISLGVVSSPVINIKPSAEDIFLKIENLLQKTNEIEGLGKAGRDFAMDTHNYINIAKQYVSSWNG